MFRALAPHGMHIVNHGTHRVATDICIRAASACRVSQTGSVIGGRLGSHVLVCSTRAYGTGCLFASTSMRRNTFSSGRVPPGMVSKSPTKPASRTRSVSGSKRERTGSHSSACGAKAKRHNLRRTSSSRLNANTNSVAGTNTVDVSGIDDAGISDALAADQDNPTHDNVDDHAELISQAPSVIGEAEDVELAAEVAEMTDMAPESDTINGTDGVVSSSAPPATSPEALLDVESPLNLRLATLTRQGGKAFRAIAVHFPLDRSTSRFELTFEDIASGARLVCGVEEVKTRYFEWISQFRAAFIALFVPTLQHPHAILLQNAILNARPARFPPPPGSYHPRLDDDPDHLLFSYSRLREVISKKRKEGAINAQLLNVTVLNAYAEEWKNFITAPFSCAPQSILLAAFNFRANDNIMLNKELLHAQLSTAASTLTAASKKGAAHRASLSPVVACQWSLIFVSAATRTAAGTSATPPMQNLLTGQFVEPLTLSGKNVIYIIGSGTAAEAFAQFPVIRKGQRRYSILLQDIESQLELQKPHKLTLTAVLARALDSFSRLTWMGLMKEETGARREPHPPTAFYRLLRRSVPHEVVPSFLVPVFTASNRSMSGPQPGMSWQHPRTGDGASSREPRAPRAASLPLVEHMNLIFNKEDRLNREQLLCDELRRCTVYLANIATAGVTAARRADNPFSSRNGIMDYTGQMWTSLSLKTPPSIAHHVARTNSAGELKEFVSADQCVPVALPSGPSTEPDAKARAENTILVTWDVKRLLLFLRESAKLKEFLYNGGKVWCAQYAQYLLKGFNYRNLATMERTLLQYHEGPLKGAMHPLEKLKLIFETQLEVAVRTRQLTSIVHRMDALLASAEMEEHGLQIVSQGDVTHFANTLRLDHERLEKVLQQKIMDFTKSMDSDVRQRINFRSPQDISTIIYGGALCRHLSSRFIPVRPMKNPITSLFPHAVCHVTGTTVPDLYRQPGALFGSFPKSASAFQFTERDVEKSVKTIERLCTRSNMEQLVRSTFVVVVLCKAKIGGLLEQISVYCPNATGEEPELNLRVAVDDVLPLAESSDMVTIGQLKRAIANYRPLQQLQLSITDDKKCFELRNVLIVTSCIYEKLEPLVDTGVIQVIEQAILGTGKAGPGERPPFERICFADLQKCFPPPPQGADTFESDFSELTQSDSMPFSAKANWEAHTRELQSLGGMEGVMKAMISHCASLVGTPRDAFRNTHPVPSCFPQGQHGQERASTIGMLWMVTPPALHPVLQRCLKGRGASSGADAMERVTVFLSPYKNIDLSFFTALQQLRFTEKKLQLFEEGCLFRAVLPESNDRVHGELCHCVTATGRLSSQSPNLQNIPKEEDLRRLIISRFGAQGRMIEADYSQLEVVVLAALCRDPRMMQELRAKVDFHCLRVALMTKEPYEEVMHKVKVLKDPHYIQLRQQAKVFSFQRQYGAGIGTISSTTGLTEQEVDRLITAEEQHYSGLSRYYRLVMECVEAGADRLLRLRTLDTSLCNASQRRVLMMTEPLYYFVVPTGSKFDFAKDRKSIPRLKNYPVQGLAGEIVQIMCGKIVRQFYKKRNYNNKSFLVNTVHDCVWIDCHESVAEEVKTDIAQIMGDTQRVIGELWPDMKLDVPFYAEIHDGPSLGELSN